MIIIAILGVSSFVYFWGGVFWLLIQLLRKGSVKQPLGVILLGIIFGVAFLAASFVGIMGSL